MHNQKIKTRVALAGEKGFISQNLLVRLREKDSVLNMSLDQAVSLTENDYVVYIYNDNDLVASDTSCSRADTEKLEEVSQLCKRKANILLFSQQSLSIPESPSNLTLYQIPNVFGKWANACSKNIIAMACQKIINEEEVDFLSEREMEQIYIDDLTSFVLRILDNKEIKIDLDVPKYKITGTQLISLLKEFKNSRDTLVIPDVGGGFLHALYATYISYMDKGSFSYTLENHSDSRGSFIEILKTEKNGQMSCLTARPGITRGQHYHHSKSEKFLVVKGQAKFTFRNLLNNDHHELIVSADSPEIIETIPGWVHNITNIGNEEIIVFLWANELFDPDCPDTIAGEI